ncbi:MAG: hypothetical protein JW891_10090 [Candidatus Lokiarchaeota archaeon]|nr:hypothetical protein [Candidatus Lokiarchaeota archaeon]
MLSVFGTSLILIQDKGKFIEISVGLILGLIVAYIFISILFLFFIRFFVTLYLFKYIFAGLLIIVGAWQIIECKKERSVIFGTPEKVKSVLRNFIEKNSVVYSFLVGVIFVLIKIPCFGGVYLALLYNVFIDPLLILFIISYLTGLVVPIVIILVALR